ncbi:MAG: transglycosylase domain-containing protein [Myxococcales bacterium]|nr:transglycosylase domain-containing protein [Myxococcales bacterium]
MTSTALALAAAPRLGPGLGPSLGPSLGRVWRVARVPIAALLLTLVVALEITIVAVLAWPIDRAELVPAGDDARWVHLDEVPSIAQAAVIEAEDDGFCDHRCVELRGLARAAWLDARAGRVAFGGSTLSMQVARLRYTHTEPRSVARKVREAVLALRLERALDKRELLEQWWNRADFGNGAIGLRAAAATYFGKPVAALTTGEAVMLACLPRAPRAYDPYVHPEALRQRRDRVLGLLVARGHLDQGTAQAAAAAALTPAPR